MANEAVRQMAEWHKQLHKLWLLDKQYGNMDVWDTFARLSFLMNEEQFSELFNILIVQLENGNYEEFCDIITENGMMRIIARTGLVEWMLRDVFKRLFIAREK